MQIELKHSNTGIQDDPDGSHAQAVSKKTAQCLLRAEVIYRTHLCFDNDGKGDTC